MIGRQAETCPCNVDDAGDAHVYMLGMQMNESIAQ